MDPARRMIVSTDDAVFAVEEFAPTEHFPIKIRGHIVAIIGVNQGDPAIDRAFIVGFDSEDLIKDIGGRPEHGLQIEYVAAEAGDALGLLQ